MSDKWNDKIRLYPSDRIFALTFGRLFPAFVRPNHLTVFRVLLTPFVVLALANDNILLGTALFLLAAISDWFDGALARTRRHITEWGIVYDPVADKLLVGSVLAVIVMGHINLSLGLILIGLEILIIFFSWVRVRQGQIVPANIWGKAKMVAEVCGILMLLIALELKMNLLVNISMGTLALAIVFALVSIMIKIK